MADARPLLRVSPILYLFVDLERTVQRYSENRRQAATPYRSVVLGIIGGLRAQLLEIPSRRGSRSPMNPSAS